MSDPRMQERDYGMEQVREEEAGIELDPRIQDMIGRSLQAHYEDILKAPLPDNILVLLAELEAKEKSGS